MPTSEREIITKRIFNVQCEDLFVAWTDPDRLKQWWGPKGFTNTFYEFDLRPDGLWRYTMHGPDGTDYYNECKFIEFIPGERIIFDHITEHRYRAKATFSEMKNTTTLVWSMVFESEKEFKKVKQFIIEGNEQNLDRLELYLTGAR